MLSPILDTEVTLGIRDWFYIAGVLLAGSTAWWKLTNKINGVGARTTVAGSTATEAKILADKVHLEMEGARGERAAIRERVAAVEIATAKLTEELSEERMAVMTTLHNNERAASERDTALQVQLATLTERIDVDRIVRSVVREFKES